MNNYIFLIVLLFIGLFMVVPEIQEKMAKKKLKKRWLDNDKVIHYLKHKKYNEILNSVPKEAIIRVVQTEKGIKMLNAMEEERRKLIITILK